MLDSRCSCTGLELPLCKRCYSSGIRSDKASRPGLAPAQPPSWAAAAVGGGGGGGDGDDLPSPESCPAAASCICTACSGTRSWPGWRWVWGSWPGAPSPGRTGNAAAWSAAPAQTPEPGRRGRGVSSWSSAACWRPSPSLDPHTHPATPRSSLRGEETFNGTSKLKQDVLITQYFEICIWSNLSI